MKKLGGTAALILFGFLCGFGAHQMMKLPEVSVIDETVAPDKSFDLVEFEDNYTLINPLLSCADTELSRFTNRTSSEIEKQVEAYIAAEKKAGHVADVSVYYKDLNSGPWAIVNKDLLSLPGSLLKVPVVMSVYKNAEVDTALLDKKIEVKEEDIMEVVQDYVPAEKVEVGKTYSIQELIRLVLVYSDNNATRLLSNVLTNDNFRDSFEKLGIESPDPADGNYKLAVRTYASFFRILYNASYLNKDYSQKLLETLTGSVFKEGIVAGVPENVVVSHKFGERNVGEGLYQLHDCGIIYNEDAPYILCVMTHGDDFKELTGVVAGISKIVYDVIEDKTIN